MVVRPTFTYQLASTGWARATIGAGDDQLTLTASYLSDALGDLLAGLSLLVEGGEEIKVSWLEEPGEYRWLFRRSDRELSLEVLAFDDWLPEQSDEEGRKLFALTCPLVDFVRSVADAAQDVLDEWGEDGYRSTWFEHAFPAETLQELAVWASRQDDP